METDSQDEGQELPPNHPHLPTSDGSEGTQGQAAPTLSFIDQAETWKSSLDESFNDHKKDIQALTSEDEMSSLDWDELEGQYYTEIALKKAEEREITNEFEQRFQVCDAFYKRKIYSSPT